MLDIQPMCEADLDEVAVIERLCFGERWSVNAFRSELAKGNCIYHVAHLDGRPVGYIGYWLILEEAHITAVAVRPDLQQRGFGAELVLHALDDCMARGGKWMTLEVRASNLAAQRLYEGFGFRTLGRRKGYYHDDQEDALIMWTDNLWHDAQKAVVEQVRHRIEARREQPARPKA